MSANNIVFKREFEVTTYELEGKQTRIWSVAFDPLGKCVLIGTDKNILICDYKTGALIHSINEHEVNVYCVAFHPNGKQFASGGGDKNVMLWNRNGQGILKYSHNYSIEHLEYNPISFELISITSFDICLWNTKQNKRVYKSNIPSKCLSVNWSPNGKLFVLSLQNNSILIYDKSGKQIHSINKNDHNKHDNIVCCKWYDHKRLMVASWNKKLSFYDIESDTKDYKRMKVKNVYNIKLDFYPNAICSIRNSCIIISGLDNYLHLYTAQGTFIEKYKDIYGTKKKKKNNKKVNNQRDWILSICNQENSRKFCYGTNNGYLVCNKIIFKTVHSLQDNLYAYRAQNLCNLYVENMITKQKELLKTNGYIKMIAVYKYRLAVLFNDKLLIYSSNQHDQNDMNYKLTNKIDESYDCNLLIITNNHLIICTENKFKAVDFDGKKLNEWKFNNAIRYIKNISGAPNKEGMLVGLANGEIYTVFINKKYPIFHYQHNSVIRCVDISTSKSKLAIVGEDRKLCIYDLEQKKILLQDTNANAVAFNDEFDDIFAFTSKNIAIIRNFNGNFQYTAKTDGFIVHFSASTVYTLFSSTNTMASFKIPQSQPLKRYIQSKSFDNAYKIACLGVTKYEWKNLGLKAIESMRFDVARKAFTNLSSSKDVIKYTDFVNFIEMQYHNQSGNKENKNDKNNLLMADIFAYQGEFDKASKIYCSNKQYHRAIEMYLDLRDWENAKELIERYNASSTPRSKSSYSMNDLLLKQAKWLQSSGDEMSAADMYWSAKQYKQGFDLLFETKKFEVIKPKILSLLSQNSQNIESDEKLIEFYQYVASKFRKLNDIAFIKDVYIATKNYSKLIEIYIEREEWDEAFIIINEHKEMKKDILLPYAKWLAMNDKFDEASKAFHEAGYPKYAIKILNNLTQNCLTQKKYNDTAYYYWLLAIEHLKFNHIQKFKMYREKSQLYYAYNIINQYIQSPFTSYTAEILFYAAKFALNLYDENSKISKVALLYILAKQCMELEAYKLARSIISKLITLRIPTEWRDRIELDSLLIRTKPFTDPQHLASYICPRCSTTNYNSNHSQICTHCKHRFIHCMISFQSLPLVEFKIIDSLSHDEAIKLIKRVPPKNDKNEANLFGIDDDENDNDDEEDVNVMNLDDMDEDLNSDDNDNDVFYQQLMNFDNNDGGEDESDLDGNMPSIILDGIALEKINPSEIFVIDYRKYCKDMAPKYYRCIVPEECDDIIICPNCQLLFRGEEYEVALINNGHLCPFCRYKFSS